MQSLEQIVEQSLSRHLGDDVKAMAQEVLRQVPYVDSILAYGSVLRGVPVADTLIDFYAVVHDRRGLSASKFGQFFGDLLPPNVYFVQTEFGGQTLRCKCTVVTFEGFLRWVAKDTRSPYFWARFSQPSALVYVRDTVAHLRVVELITRAIRTAYGNAVALAPTLDAISQWKQLYSATYRTELRPEGTSRSDDVVQSNVTYYMAVAKLLSKVEPLQNNWIAARFDGKVVSILRLCKAAFTFQGGADYAVWKIHRHTGERIELQNWQRKHPIIAGLLLLPRLMRKKIIR